MRLNIRAQTTQDQYNNSSIVLVHGLFGSLDDLDVLVRDLVNNHSITQINMRNHGLPPGEPVMNCLAIAQDLVGTLDALQIGKAIFIGHPMGGEAVMALTALAPDCINKLVAIDIAPVDYHARRYDEIFVAINAVSESDAQTRQQVTVIMRQYLNEEGVTQFLLRSSIDGERRSNVPVLQDQYPHIVGWEKIPAWDHPVLFISGGNSPYVSEQYHDDLLAQFPQARVHVITGAGHWVHAKKPDVILRVIRRYLND